MMKTVGSAFEMKQEDWSMEEFQIRLATKIEELLQKDLVRLINILYRLDVDEEKLKTQIANQPVTNAALLISKLIIERQIKRLETRWQQGKREDIPDGEKW